MKIGTAGSNIDLDSGPDVWDVRCGGNQMAVSLIRAKSNGGGGYRRDREEANVASLICL